MRDAAPRRRGLLLVGAAAALAAPAAARAADGLRGIAAARGIRFGLAVQGDALVNDPRAAAAVAAEAAVLVPEGGGKWLALRPEEGVYDFSELDAIIAFAARHGQTVRGHTLLWHAAMEDWTLAALKEGAARGRSILEAHFDRVLAHTAPAIRDWDVANEAVADPRDSADLLRKSPWLDSLGPDYLDLAFRAARQRDAGLALTYNDYGCEQDTPVDDEKRRRVLALVRGMRDRGVPVDAVGIQGHLRLGDAFSAPKLAAFVRSLRDLGLRVLVTELDMIEDELRSDAAGRDARSAALVHAFVSTVLEGGGDAVLCWGVTDPHSWIGREPGYPALVSGLPARPLPLDAEYRRKPMWHALARAFEGRPWP